MRSNRLGANSRSSKRGRKQQGTGRRTVATVPQKQDNALLLRPEYSGQPVCAHIMCANPVPLTTNVTTGVIAYNLAIQSSIINNFASRFVGYTEFRVVKAVAKVRCSSSNGVGVLNHWFSEDDTAAPTASKTTNALALRFPAGDIIGSHDIKYVPHDPAQQTWTLVSSGNPIIGYYKFYTDNANWGSPIVSTQLCTLEFELTVQFRGFI